MINICTHRYIPYPDTHWIEVDSFKLLVHLLQQISDKDFAEKIFKIIMGLEVDLSFNENESLHDYSIDNAKNNILTNQEILHYLFYYRYITIRVEGGHYSEIDESFKNFFRASNAERIQDLRRAIKNINDGELYQKYHELVNFISIMSSMIDDDKDLTENMLKNIQHLSYPGVNFNLLHIASMSNNPELYITKLKEYTSNQTFLDAINQDDGLYHLSPIEYLYLFHRYTKSQHDPKIIIQKLGSEEITEQLIQTIEQDEYRSVDKCIDPKKINIIANIVSGIVGLIGGTMTTKCLPDIGKPCILIKGFLFKKATKYIIKKFLSKKQCHIENKVETDDDVENLKKVFFDNNDKYLHLDSCAKSTHKEWFCRICEDGLQFLEMSSILPLYFEFG